MNPQVRPNLPGLATHWPRGTYEGVAACGTFGGLHTTDPQKVDCRRCRRTRAWRAKNVKTQVRKDP